MSAYFCSVNWGKKSLAIDLSKAEGRKIVQTLSAQTDVIITSYKPGDAEKLGVDYKTLSGLNPKLIYGQITGYGSQNDRVGYDAVIQAEAGFIDLNGEKDGPPTKMPVALMDLLAGHHLKEGLLLSLLKRERTGQGDLVEVSLLQTAISSLINQASNWLVVNKLPHRQGSAHPNIAPYGESFETADGKLILTGDDAGTARLWDGMTGLPLTGWVKNGVSLKRTHLSPDGKWALSASEDGTVRVWRVLRASLPAPAWLTELAEALAGRRLRDDGALEQVPPERWFALNKWLGASTADDLYARWAKWFLVERMKDKPLLFVP